jgi:hypothetical protein
MYTHDGQGLRNKQDVLEEYVACKDKGNTRHVNTGIHKPVEVISYKKAMAETSFIHITGGMKVSCNDDITWSGRLTKDGYTKLVALWSGRVLQAQQEPSSWQQ